MHLSEELAAKLTAEFGRGFSPANLSHMRRFFLVWKERVRIFQQPAEESRIEEKGQQPAGELAAIPVSTQPVRKSPFTLSWTHCRSSFSAFGSVAYFASILARSASDWFLGKGMSGSGKQPRFEPMRRRPRHQPSLRMPLSGGSPAPTMWKSTSCFAGSATLTSTRRATNGRAPSTRACRAMR